MGVASVQYTAMQGDTRLQREGLQEMVEHISWQSFDVLTMEVRVDDRIGTARQIDSASSQSFVERDSRIAHPGDTGPLADGLAQRLTQDDGDILHQVVGTSIIAGRIDSDIQYAVARDLRKHVVEETLSGFAFVLTRAVQVERDADVRFPSSTVHGCDPLIR